MAGKEHSARLELACWVQIFKRTMLLEYWGIRSKCSRGGMANTIDTKAVPLQGYQPQVRDLSSCATHCRLQLTGTVLLQRPMDLGSVAQKLQKDRYRSLTDVRADINLIWRNCQTFNEPGSDVHEESKELASVFDRLWSSSGCTKLEAV